MTGGSEKQTSSRCSIVSRSSRRPDLPAGRPPRAGEVKEGRRPARRRRALSLTGLSTVAPFLRSRRRKRLDAEHGISPGLQPFWLLSGRNSTYPVVQISKASSLCRLHAPFTPVAACPVIRLPAGLSREMVSLPVLTTILSLTTRLRRVHFRSSLRHIPAQGISLNFSSNAHHHGS